jgi:putative DNA primase/helicase
MMAAPISATGGQRLDQADVQRARETSIRDVWAWLGQPELPANGGNARAPWRNDSSPSLQVGGEKNIAYDHGTGEAFDAIALVQKVKECTFGEAIKWILNEHSSQAPARASRPKGKPEPTPILPVPDDAPMPPAEHFKHGRPSRRWEYRDAQGQLLGYVCRFDKAEGKEIRPLTFCQMPDGSRAWQWQTLPEPRPLYGLDRLATRPDASVLWVEGEKTADAATLLFPDFVVIMSPGGCGAVGKTNYRPLKGRRVWVWGDADAPGCKAAQDVARLALAAGAAEVHIVAVPVDFPDKWDLADTPPAGWDVARLRELLNAAPIWKSSVLPTSDASATGAQACPDFDNNGHPIPLGIAQNIHRRRQNLVSVRGDFFDFTGKVFEPVETVTIDADAVEILGSYARRSNLGDIRHLLMVAVHRPKDFFDDADQNYLHLENGVLNIEKLTLEAHDPKFRALNLLPVSFDASADCPRFKQALNEWLPGDVDAQELLIEFAGYCLIKDVSLEIIIFLVGEGGNGKGRFFHVLEMLLGRRNISGLPLAALRAERTFPITALVGKLLNICPESEFSTDLDEGIIKSLVSGDPLEIERKGRDAFLFHNKARFIVQSNNPPHINDKSNAFWRRLIVIRFNAIFSQEQADASLDAKFALELSGILNMALAGLHRLAARGRFNPTPNMLAELTSYRRECNPLATWREDRLIEAEPDWTGRPAWVSCANVYENYRGWCKENGHVSYSRAKFARELKRLGLEQGVFRDDSGRAFKGFAGVKINE